jgi:hypothetical protein
MKFDPGIYGAMARFEEGIESFELTYTEPHSATP